MCQELGVLLLEATVSFSMVCNKIKGHKTELSKSGQPYSGSMLRLLRLFLAEVIIASMVSGKNNQGVMVLNGWSVVFILSSYSSTWMDFIMQFKYFCILKPRVVSVKIWFHGLHGTFFNLLKTFCLDIFSILWLNPNASSFTFLKMEMWQMYCLYPFPTKQGAPLPSVVVVLIQIFSFLPQLCFSNLWAS